MDNELLEGETSTPQTHDRGEISGNPAGSAEPNEATSEPPIHRHEEE